MKEIWVCAKIPEFKHSNSVADSYLYWFWSDCCIFKNIDDVRIAAVFSGYWFGLVCDIFFANIDKVRILLVFFIKYLWCSGCGNFLWILMLFGMRQFFCGYFCVSSIFVNIDGVWIAFFFCKYIDRILIAKVFFCKYWGDVDCGIFCDSLGSSSLAG